MPQPHVFVLRADLTHLAADAWLLPTDRTLDVTPGWLDKVPGLHEAVENLGDKARPLRDEEVFALPLPDWPADQPQPVLVAVPFTGIFDAEQARPRLLQGLQSAARVARERPSRGRPLPLIGVPMFGTAGGGGDRLRGQLLEVLLEVANQVAREEQVDVAVALRRPVDLAQAQATRRDAGATWQALGSRVEDARALARKARSGELVPFLGAGVSASAGLPLWHELVERLASAVDLPPDVRESFDKLGVLDQANVLRLLYTEKKLDFPGAVANHAKAERYGLAPALLAGLPTTEAVTLNYDTLYELATRDAGRELAVLPEDTVLPGQRWLLKLHGSVGDPKTIVLTREDYLGYGRGRAALSALAKALLLTRHLLFVGFGLADDHFHEIMHDVREVLPPERRGATKLGAALVLRRDALQERLWSSEIDLVPVGGDTVAEQARMLEIFLDCLLAHTEHGLQFFLDRRYEHRLTEPEKQLRDRLNGLASDVSEEERNTQAWSAIERALRELGRDVVEKQGM